VIAFIDCVSSRVEVRGSRAQTKGLNAISADKDDTTRNGRRIVFTADIQNIVSASPDWGHRCGINGVHDSVRNVCSNERLRTQKVRIQDPDNCLT
jgi:hypothetical protein